MRKSPAIFLDRDGTICDEVGAITKPSQIRLLPGVPEAIKLLKEAGWKIVVVTNQPIIARNWLSEEELGGVHNAFQELLADENATVDAIYYCPHHPQGSNPRYSVNCNCRKPDIGLLLRASNELGIDLGKSIMIGDRYKDIACGNSAGCYLTCLVLTGVGFGEWQYYQKKWPRMPDIVAGDLLEVAKFVIDEKLFLNTSFSVKKAPLILNDKLFAQDIWQWPPVDEDGAIALLKQYKLSGERHSFLDIINELECDFENKFRSKHALACASGSSALACAFFGAGISKGDRVIVPAYCHHSSLIPLLQLGAEPVFVEVDDRGMISLSAVERFIQDRVKAILVLHAWGMTADILSLRILTDKHNIVLIEDFSLSIGALKHGKYIGTFGNVGIASLNIGKLVPSGEGGIMLTDNDEIYKRSLIYGHMGQRAREEIDDSHPWAALRTVGLGIKAKINPFSAALAKVRLCQLNGYLETRRKYAKMVVQCLEDFSVISPLFDKEDIERLAFMSIPVRVKENLRDRIFHDICSKGGHAFPPSKVIAPFDNDTMLKAYGIMNNGERYKLWDQFKSSKEFHNRLLNLGAPNSLSNMKLIEAELNVIRSVALDYRHE